MMTTDISRRAAPGMGMEKMATYNVNSASPSSDGIERFLVRGYPTGRTSCTVETESTSDRELAQSWAGKDPAGVRVAMYADD